MSLTRAMEPLADRLLAISLCDPIGQAALCGVAFFGYAMIDLPPYLEKYPQPFEFAFSVEVLGPVLLFLLVGTLLTVDYRNRARDEVRQTLSTFTFTICISCCFPIIPHARFATLREWTLFTLI